jgi:hypothetical protein
MQGDSLKVPFALRNFCARYQLGPPEFLACRGQNAVSGMPHYCFNHEGIQLVLAIFRERRILILRRWPETSVAPPREWRTDILVLVEHVRCNPDSLINVFKPGQVIVDGSSHARVHAAMAQACRQHGIPFHSTEKDGFYTYGDI